MKITVLAGGYSPERDVSLTSGSLIANSLIRSGHKVALVDSYIGIDLPDDAESIFIDKGEYSYKIAEKEPDLKELKKAHPENGDAVIGKGVIEACRMADVVFMALHGASGENGQVQAMLDLFGIKYTGSGYEGCLLAMNKCISKEIFRERGITTAPAVCFRGETKAEMIQRTETEIGYPCVVKTSSCGSSVGVSITADREELEKALDGCLEYGDEIVVEKKIVGREFSVGVLCGRALPPIEIIPKCGFYDYKNKYQANMTEEKCPADITEKEDEELRSSALKVHNALRLGRYSRVDFILEKDSGKAYCLEANALPGMTPISLLPQEAKADGISYDKLCEMIAGIE